MIAKAHGIGDHDAAVEHYVAVNRIVGADGAPRPEARSLTAANTKVHFERIDFELFALGEPPSLLRRIRKGRKHTLRRRGIAGFNHKRGVSHGSLFHRSVLLSLP